MGMDVTVIDRGLGRRRSASGENTNQKDGANQRGEEQAQFVHFISPWMRPGQTLIYTFQTNTLPAKSFQRIIFHPVSTGPGPSRPVRGKFRQSLMKIFLQPLFLGALLGALE